MKWRLCLKITVILENLKSHYCSRQEKKYIYEKESIVLKKNPVKEKNEERWKGQEGLLFTYGPQKRSICLGG